MQNNPQRQRGGSCHHKHCSHITFRKALDSITTAPSENVELLNKQITELEAKISSLKSEISSLESSKNSPIEDVFQGDDKATTDASTTAIKEESKALEQISDSAKEASESKEKFAKKYLVKI